MCPQWVSRETSVPPQYLLRYGQEVALLRGGDRRLEARDA